MLPEKIINEWKAKFNIEERYSKLLISNHQATSLLELVFIAAPKKDIKPNDIAKEIVNKNIKFNKNLDSEKIINSYQKLHQTDNIDLAVLKQAIDEILTANSDATTKYKNGKTQVIGFLLGQVAQKLQQKLDMKQVKLELIKALKN